MVVYIDDSVVSPAVIPGTSGVTNCFGRTEFRPYRQDGENFTSLTVADGATLLSPYKFTGSLFVGFDQRSATLGLDFDYSNGAFGATCHTDLVLHGVCVHRDAGDRHAPSMCDSG